MTRHRETLTFLAIWRKALSLGTLSFPLPTRSTALSTRMALYNAIKPYRGLDRALSPDPELTRAVEELQVSIKDNVLTLEPRRLLTVANDLALLLDLDISSPEEAAMIARLKGEVDPPKVESVPNPFFGER